MFQRSRPMHGPRQERHPLDRFYNFFSRSVGWCPTCRVKSPWPVVRLNPSGCCISSSTTHSAQLRQKRLRLGLVPRCGCLDGQAGSDRQWQPLGRSGIGDLHPETDKIYRLPIHAKLHLAGKNQKSSSHTGQGNAWRHPGMVSRSKVGFPRRWGLFDEANLLGDLDPVTYVGVMRADAAIYDPVPAKQSKDSRGPKATKGPRLPNPKEAMKKADCSRSGYGPWTWQMIKATPTA